MLIDHKVQSSSLHKELDSLARDREKVTFGRELTRETGHARSVDGLEQTKQSQLREKTREKTASFW